MRLYIWRGFLKNWKANNKNGADIQFYAPSFNVNIPPYLASPVMFSSLLDFILAPGERGSALVYSVAPIFFGSSLASWPLFLPFLSTSSSSSSSFLYPMAFPRLQASSSIIRSLFPHLNSTQSVDFPSLQWGYLQPVRWVKISSTSLLLLSALATWQSGELSDIQLGAIRPR